MEFRQASESDLAGEYAVSAAAQEELHNRRGASWLAPAFDPSGMWAQVHRHLLAHDGERAFVAELDGRIVGFTAALVRGDCWFFSALFIDPAQQGRGVGRRLLDLAWDGMHRRRITITEALQPVSTGMYAARGLLPVTPVLGFAGQPATEPIGGALQPATPAPKALQAIDLVSYGFDRAVDHEFWARTSARATLWLDACEPCAYSYSGAPFYRGGLIGPVAGRDAASAAQALRAELAASAGKEIRVDIPGSATTLVEVALESGLRLTDPGLLLLSSGQPSPTAYAIHSYWLLLELLTRVRLASAPDRPAPCGRHQAETPMRRTGQTPNHLHHIGAGHPEPLQTALDGLDTELTGFNTGVPGGMHSSFLPNLITERGKSMVDSPAGTARTAAVMIGRPTVR